MAKVFLEIEIDAEGNVTAIEGAENALNRVDKAGDKAAASMEKVRRAQDQLADGAIMAGTAIVAGSAMAISAASDLEEARNKVVVVFGREAKAIQEWSETAARSLGLSKQEALEAAGTFGNLFTSMNLGQAESADMSRGLVELAGDLASFNNIDPTEALEKLRAGLVGEVEPLRTLGVQLSAAAVEAKVLEMGLDTSSDAAMSAAKLQARYALILEQTTNAQGDFKRTSDGLANSQRIVTALLKDAAAAIGQALLPMVEKVLPPVVGLVEAGAKFAETPMGKTAIVVGSALGVLALGAGLTHKAVTIVSSTMQAVNIIMGIYKARIIANTIALKAETGALAFNTGAQKANAIAAGRAGAARGIGGAARGVGGALTGGAGLMGLLGTGVGGIGALGVGAVGTSVALGAGAAYGGWKLGEAVRAPIYRSGVMGGGMKEFQEQQDLSRKTTADVAGKQEQLMAMSSAERKAFVARGGFAEGATAPLIVGTKAAAIPERDKETKALFAAAEKTAKAADKQIEALRESRGEYGYVSPREEQRIRSAVRGDAVNAMKLAEKEAKKKTAVGKAVEKIVLEVKGDSIGADALAKEIARHPEIIAAINERIGKANAP